MFSGPLSRQLAIRLCLIFKVSFEAGIFFESCQAFKLKRVLKILGNHFQLELAFLQNHRMLTDKQCKGIRMHRGPKGERRPADAISNAIMIAKIANGEIGDITTEDGKNAAAVALGRLGGKARAAGMTAKKRKEIAQRAAATRWSKT